MLKTKATVEEIAKEVSEFLSSYIKINNLIIYGSYAYGSPRQDSDFDIAVISADFKKMNILEKMDLFAKTALATDSRVEIKGFSKEEFLHPEEGSLLEIIKRNGKAILL